MFNHKRIQTYYSVLGAVAYNEKLFDEFFLDDSINIDKQSLIDYIVMENADLPLQEVNIDILPLKIKLWCSKNKYNWKMIYRTLHADYNPIHNYDRHEEGSKESSFITESNTEGETTSQTNGSETIDHTGEKTDTFNTTERTAYGKTETRTDNLSESTTHGHAISTSETGSESTSKDFSETKTEGGTETNTHENTAFNASMSATAKDTIGKNFNESISHDEDISTSISKTGTESHSGVDTVANTGTQGNVTGGTDTITKTGTIQYDDTATDEKEYAENTSGSNTVDASENGESDENYNNYMYGNIGVTTTQQMIQSEIDLRTNKDNNFYDIVAKQFKQDFCLMIY